MTLGLASIGMATGAANAAVTLALGSASSSKLDASTSTTGISQSSPYASGTFATANPASVTFDLLASSTNGNLTAQPGGWGVTGGSAAFGIDNQSGNLETITYTISNVTGLGVGESLVFRTVSLDFGTDSAGETYRIDGGGNISFTSSPQNAPLADPTSFTIGAGTSGDSRFVVNGLTVAVIPEPSTALLGALGFLALLRRRR